MSVHDVKLERYGDLEFEQLRVALQKGLTPKTSPSKTSEDSSMNCPLANCSLNHPDAPQIRCTNEQHGNVPAVTRKSTQDLLDDYDNRIKCLQAGRANVQRTMDEFPVEVCPKELARLRRIEEEAHTLSATLFQCGVPPMPMGEERTLPYLARMFRGRNMVGCFRGRH